MAQRVVVTLSDDIDGGEAAETVTFALDGKSYEIDLNPANAKKLRKSLAPYVAMRPKADKCWQARQGPGGVPPHVARTRPAAVRAWARSHRMEVAGPRPDPQEGLRGVQRRQLRAAPGMFHSGSPLSGCPDDSSGSRLAQHPRRSARVWSTPKGKAGKPGPTQRAGVVQ